MLLVSCQQIKKYHGVQLVLANVTMEVQENERIGIIGRNGCGKSTLMQLLSGALQPDAGELAVRKGTRIGYLAQLPAQAEGMTVYDVLARGYRDVLVCRDGMTQLENEMSQPEISSNDMFLEQLLAKYAQLQTEYENKGGYEMDAHIQQVANGLGIPSEQWGRPYAILSDGEKTKVDLASLLIERPNLLLLDEPTNHLDLHAVEWLETFLRDYAGTCLIVSHDRFFLDRVVTRIVELEDGEAVTYYTNYTGYVKEKEERLLRQFAEYKEQQKQIKKMKETIKQLEEWGRIGGNEKFFRRAASMQKALDRMEKLKRPVMEQKTADFAWKLKERSGEMAAVFEGVRKRFGDKVILESADGTITFGEKIALVGRNGAGKTTLFKMLLGEVQPEAGTLRLGSRIDIGYLAQEESPVEHKQSVLQYFKQEAGLEEGEARGRLAKYLFFGSDVFKSVGLLSGGEWTRLRLALLVHRMPNLLLLDEPTNHLDIASRESLEENLEEFPGTVLAISHDRYFINKLAHKVWELRDGKIHRYFGNFDEFREKQAQLLAGTPSGELVTPQVEHVKVPRPQSASAAASTRRINADAEKVRAELERIIQQQEERLQTADAQLNDPVNVSSPSALADAWAEKEKIQADLKILYEKWMQVADSIEY